MHIWSSFFISVQKLSSHCPKMCLPVEVTRTLCRNSFLNKFTSIRPPIKWIATRPGKIESCFSPRAGNWTKSLYSFQFQWQTFCGEINVKDALFKRVLTWGELIELKFSSPLTVRFYWHLIKRIFNLTLGPYETFMDGQRNICTYLFCRHSCQIYDAVWWFTLWWPFFVFL